MDTQHYYVYILCSRIGGTLYIGETNDLVRRVFEHKSKFVEGFTEKYDVARLVYFEQFDDPESDQTRETIEEMAESLEDFADREGQSGLERSLSSDSGGRWIGLWDTGSSGQAGR